MLHLGSVAFALEYTEYDQVLPEEQPAFDFTGPVSEELRIRSCGETPPGCFYVEDTEEYSISVPLCTPEQYLADILRSENGATRYRFP